MQVSLKIITLAIISILIMPAGGMFQSGETGETTSNSRGLEGRAITSADLVWPMFGKDKHHTFIADPTPKGIFTPAEKWASDFQIDSLGAAVGNFKANVFGTPLDRDVNFIVYAEGGVVKVVDGSTGESTWEMDVDLIDGLSDGDLVQTSPAIGDLNKNGKMDIIFAVDDGTNSSYVYSYEPVIKYSGTNYSWESDNYATERLWGYYTGVDMGFSSPVIADLDGNGNQDVIIGGSGTSAWVFAIDGAAGTALSGNWPYQLSGTRCSTPAIYEFGISSRVVITSIELETYYVYVISDNGQTLHQTSIDMNLPIGLVYSLIPSPAIGQLNRSSSSDEIVVLVPIVTSTGRVYCFSNDLTELWSATWTDGQFESSPALVNIDSDPEGDLDVVVASWDSFGSHQYAIEGRTGEEIWSQYKNLGVGVQNIVASPTLVDVNTDNAVDAVFVAEDEVYALNGTNGDYLWNFTLPTPTGTRFVRSSPAVGDIDKDKFLDIFIDGSLVSHYIIDLTLNANEVEFSMDEPIQGQEISITALIHNTGQAEAQDVFITFMEDSTFIGNSTITSIPGGDTRGATVQWTPEKAGDVTLTISVDPDNTIEEIVENNNIISLTKTVKAAFPDLTFDELRFYRGDGKRIDNINTHLIEAEESRIGAVVRNIGGLTADNILVRFREGGVNLGVDQLIGQLGVNKTFEIGMNWTPNLGFHGIEALADPINGIVESNESNNHIMEDSLFVKSKDPGGAPYMMTGTVFMPDGVTPAPSISVTYTNEQTHNFIAGITASDGSYSRDLNDIMGSYLEGDLVSIFATDGTNESMIKFKAYSEDGGRSDNLTLTSLPRYAVDLSTADDALDIVPGSSTQFSIMVKNQGNTNDSVQLNHSIVYDVNTNQPAMNWSINLDAYSIDDLASGAVLERKLTIRAPSKSSEAQAGQVVRATVLASSGHDASKTDELTVYATLTRKYSIALEASPSYIELDPSNSTIAVFNLNITNFGNGPDIVNIVVTNVTLDVITVDTDQSIELDAGMKTSSELILHLDSAHSPGLFSLDVQASSEDGTRTAPIQLTVRIVRPDLSVSLADIEIPANLPEIGELISIAVKIHNNGTAAAKFVEVQLLDDGLSVDLETVDKISANSIKFVYMEFVLTKTGTYNMRLELDPNDYIIETNEDNNIVVFEFALLPDLGFVGTIEMSPANPRENDKTTFKVTIINIGDVSVSDNFNVEFYYYKSSKRTRLVILDVESTIEPGKELELTADWTARQGISKIYCMVDSSRRIEESNSDNNVLMLNISVREAPVDTPEEGNSNLFILAGIIFVIIVLLIMYLMFFPAKDDYDDEDIDEDEGKDRTGRVEPRSERERRSEKGDVSSAKSKPKPKTDDDSETKERIASKERTKPKATIRVRETAEEEEEEEPEDEDTPLDSIARGLEGLNPFAKSRTRRKKKVKRKKPGKRVVVEAEIVEDLDEDDRKAVVTKAKRRREQEMMSKVKKADSLLKARELREKEQRLEHRSEILRKREREIKSVKDDLVEIGILEADILDELEKEELELADEEEDSEDAVEVEPIE
jgi:subtilase family serine protease